MVERLKRVPLREVWKNGLGSDLVFQHSMGAVDQISNCHILEAPMTRGGSHPPSGRKRP